MKKKQSFNHVLKRTAKCTTAAAVALTMVLQPCFAFTAQASASSDYSSYPTWDDPDRSYYWYDEEGRKVTSVTRAYDDGKKYTAEYKYNANGDLVYSDIKDADGNKSTVSSSFNGDKLASISSYTYNAARKTENTETVEYWEDGYTAHSLSVTKTTGKATTSIEKWYLSEDNPLKYVEVDSDGVRTQVDYTYNEHGKLLTRVATSSEGDMSREDRAYNEAGETLSMVSYEYDASSQTKSIRDRHYDTDIIYAIDATEVAGVITYKREEWYRTSDYETIREVITGENGSQSVKEYAYDADGDEILYTRVDSDGTTQKRETTYTRDGVKRVTYDSSGNTSSYSKSHDARGEQYTMEETNNYADGSSTYQKSVSSDYYGYDYIYDIKRTITAEGIETYRETTYESDGSRTIKEKTADGAVLVTKKDTVGGIISSTKTLPDGTQSETSEIRNEAGELLSEVTKYSDGSEDRVDYEYDADGDVIKTTETRKSGVGAVIMTQYNPANVDSYIYSVAFNNGLQYVKNVEELDDYRDHIVMTYSGGDIAEIIYTDTTEDTAYIKTTYRDGKIEELFLDVNIDEQMLLYYEKTSQINEYFEIFMDQAWGILPGQPVA